jgi:hypothetical protein
MIPRTAQVGGIPFAIDASTFDRLGSNFLSKLICDDSPFQKSDDGIYIVHADAESFSAILHFARFNVLPNKFDKARLLQEADFWLVKELVKSAVDALESRELQARRLRISSVDVIVSVDID